MKKLFFCGCSLLALWGCALTSDRPVKSDGERPPTPRVETPRTYLIGFLAFRRYTRYWSTAKEKAWLDLMAAPGRTVRIVPEDVEILNPENAAELARYRRLAIPDYALALSPTAREGLSRYVRQGGLLIAFSALAQIDGDGDYAFDPKTEKTWPRNEINPLTRAGTSKSSRVVAVKALVDCPLTRGIDKRTWRGIDVVAGAPASGNLSAKAVLNGKIEGDGDNPPPCPLELYYLNGAGAGVFVSLKPVGPFGKLLWENLLSTETLEWLTVQKEACSAAENDKRASGVTFAERPEKRQGDGR